MVNTNRIFFLSLIIHFVLFAGILTLRFFGIVTDLALLILAAVFSFEAIYLAVFIRMRTSSNTQRLATVERGSEEVRETEEKTQTALIHMGHQIKTIQHELDALRKSGILKPSTNGHQRRVQT